ncbi:GMC oxidoreductase [Cupriavidus basilensis]
MVHDAPGVGQRPAGAPEPQGAGARVQHRPVRVQRARRDPAVRRVAPLQARALRHVRVQYRGDRRLHQERSVAGRSGPAASFLDGAERSRGAQRAWLQPACLRAASAQPWPGVLLASSDARRPRASTRDLLADPRDVETMLAGLRTVRRILDQQPFRRLSPKPHNYAGLRFDGSDDDAVREFIRARTDIIFHPVGTCRMGSDAASVVDPQLRVRGVEGLRVADASVMPTLIGGNTNATAIMIGEKAADLVRGIERADGAACVPVHSHKGAATPARAEAAAPGGAHGAPSADGACRRPGFRHGRAGGPGRRCTVAAQARQRHHRRRQRGSTATAALR